MFKFKTKAEKRNVAMEQKLNSSTTADSLMSSHTCSNTTVGCSFIFCTLTIYVCQ